MQPAEIEYIKMYEVENDHWWFKGLRAVLMYWIAKISPRIVLDTGCGTGINMQKLTEIGYQVYGLDYSQTAVNLSLKRGLNNVKLGKLQKLPYENNFFDCIYSMDVIGMISSNEVPQVFKEFNRCLKPNGYLILDAAALAFLKSAHDVAWSVNKRYTLNELTVVLQEHGFRVKKATYRNFFLFPVIALYKLAKNYLAKSANRYESDTGNTSFVINLIFTPLMLFEALLLRYIDLPIGSSVFVVAQKVS